MTQINSLNSRSFYSSLAGSMLKIGYDENDIVLLNIFEPSEELKSSLLLQSNKNAILLPRIITLSTLQNSLIDFLNFCPGLLPIENIIVDEVSLAKLVAKSFTEVGANLRSINLYLDLINKYFTYSKETSLDALLEDFKKEVGSKKTVFKITDHLTQTMKAENIIPQVIARKIIMHRIIKTFDPQKQHKIFLCMPEKNEPTYITDFLAFLSTQPNVYTFKHSETGKTPFEKTFEYIECENEIEQQTIISLLVRKQLANGLNSIAIIGTNQAQNKAIASRLSAYNVKTHSTQTLYEQNYAEFFLTLFLALSKESLVPLELALILKHPCSRYFNNEAVNRLEKKYLRAPFVWGKLSELKDIVGNSDPEILHIMDELIGCANSLVTESFKDKLENHYKTFKNLCSLTLEIYFELENFVYRISRLDADFNISNADYIELIANQLKRSVLNMEERGAPVSFVSLSESVNMEADLFIIADFNEGVFPPAFKSKNLINTKSLSALGIPSTELEQQEFDNTFKKILSRNLIFIRPRTVDNQEQLISRYYLGLNLQQNTKYNSWFKQLYFNNKFVPCPRPAPNPQLSQRPRDISLSGIEKLIRNPYAYYAEYILKLKKWDKIGIKTNARELGNAVHNVLSKLDVSILTREEYISKFKEEFAIAYNHPNLAYKAVYNKRISNIASALYEYEVSSQNVIARMNEIKGSMNVGEVTVTARADRINKLGNGNIEIIDYKTGSIPNRNDVVTGKYPQLAVESLIATQGGFGFQVKQAIIKYISLKGKMSILEEKEFILDLDNIERGLNELIRTYLLEENPFIVCGDEDGSGKVEAYEHLARRDEWDF